MRKINICFGCLAFVIALLVCCALGTSASGASNQPSAPNPKPSALAAKAPEPPPQSVFVWPHDRKEGRDPFFPQANYPYREPVTTTPSTTVAVQQIRLELSGIISGAKPLASINGHTFEMGEERELKAADGAKHRVTCKQITVNEGKVVVEVDGQTQVLRLPGFHN
jgi:hypothetical protein